jgi:hypothetical protein
VVSRKEVTAMKLALRYSRYALSSLAGVVFRIVSN